MSMEKLISQLSALAAALRELRDVDSSTERLRVLDQSIGVADEAVSRALVTREELEAWHRYALCRLAEQRLGDMPLAGLLESGPESRHDIN